MLDAKHIPLEFLWRYARRRAVIPSSEILHIRECNECLHAAILCEVHRSIVKVREALEPFASDAPSLNHARARQKNRGAQIVFSERCK